MKKVVYVFLTLIFLITLYYLVDIRVVFKLITQANIYLILLAILVGIINSFLIAYKFKTIFSFITEIKTLYFWALSSVGSLISTVFPFSLGGFSMAYFLSKKAKVTYKKSLAMLILDFLIGILPIIFMAPIAYWFFYDNWLFVVFTIFLLIGIILISKNPPLIKSVVLSAVIFVFSNLQFYLFLTAYNLPINFVNFVLANSLLGVLSFVPGAPGKLGQYETLGVLTLPYLLQIDQNIVFTAMLTMRLVSTLMIFIFGYLSLYLLDIKLNVKNK